MSYWEVLAAKTENTKRAYLLAIRRFLEVNGFEGEEDAVKALRRRGADACLLKFVSTLREDGLPLRAFLLYLSGVRAWLDLHEKGIIRLSSAASSRRSRLSRILGRCGNRR